MPLAEVRTIADTLAPRAVCARTLTLTQHYVDEIVLVDDEQMVRRCAGFGANATSWSSRPARL